MIDGIKLVCLYIFVNSSEYAFKGDAYSEDDVHRFVRESLPHLSSAVHEELTELMLSATPISEIKITEQCRAVLNDSNVERVRNEIFRHQLQYFRKAFQAVECTILHEEEQLAQLISQVLPHRSQEERSFLAREIIAWNYNLPVLPSQDYLREMMHEDPELHDLFLLLTKQMTLEEFIESHPDIRRHFREEDPEN